MRTRRSTVTKKPTRNDVAREARVSGWTVSRVLNDDRTVSISDETRTRVLDVARELGYQPNINARALATGRTSTIGFWMCFLYSQYRAHVLHRMQNVMQGSDFELVIRDIEQELWVDNNLTNVYKIPVDGMIALDSPTAGKTFVRQDRETPFVSMGAFWAEDRDYVATDLYPGTIDAIRHLVDTGRKHIVHVLPQTGYGALTEARCRAYLEVLEAAGLEPHLVETGEVTLSASWQAVREYVQAHPEVDGVFCHNDDMAFGAHRALSDSHRRIGQDVALVGCDGIEETEYLSPSLSTIVQPVDEMCELAWEFLLNRIKNPSIPLQQCILHPRFVARGSSMR